MINKPMMNFLLLIALGSVADAQAFGQVEKRKSCPVEPTESKGNELQPGGDVEWDSGFPVDPEEMN